MYATDADLGAGAHYCRHHCAASKVGSVLCVSIPCELRLLYCGRITTIYPARKAMKICFHLFLLPFCAVLLSSCATATAVITPTATITQAVALVAPSMTVTLVLPTFAT